MKHPNWRSRGQFATPSVIGTGVLDNSPTKNRWLISSIISLFFLWFATYTYYYVYSIGQIKPLYSYMAFGGVAIAVAMISLRDEFRLAAPYIGRLKYFYLWFVTYIPYVVLCYLYGPQSPSSVQILVAGVEMAAIGIFGIYLFSRVTPFYSLLLVAVVCIVLGVVLNLVDFFDPSFTKVPGRAAGLYENPNISGKLLSLLMVPALVALPRRVRLWVAIAVGVAVFATFSRGAWLTWAAGFGMLVYYRIINFGGNTFTRAILAASLVLAIIYFLFSGFADQFLQGTIVGEYLDTNTAARLKGSFEDSAASSRLDLVYISFKHWASAPLFGHGLGFTTIWDSVYRPHNMFLLFLVEGGLVGIIFFLALPTLLWLMRDSVARVVAVQFLVSSLFTHNNLDQPAMILVIVLSIVLAARRRVAFVAAKR